MQEYFIVTGTVTYAIKARDILRRNGFFAKVEKINDGSDNIGCGYAVRIKSDINTAVDILNASGVKILKIKNIN